MMYLAFKDLVGSADSVIMATSSIMKDTAVGNDVVYRPNAIRALCRIIDVRCFGSQSTDIVLIIYSREAQ